MILRVERCIKKLNGQWVITLAILDNNQNLIGYADANLPVEHSNCDAETAVVKAINQIRLDSEFWDGEPQFTIDTSMNGKAFMVSKNTIERIPSTLEEIR